MWSKLPTANNQHPRSLPPSTIAWLTAIWAVAALCAVNSVSAQFTDSETKLAQATQSPPLGSPSRSLPPPIPATPSPQETATVLMHNALRQAVWGPAVTCKIRQRVTLLDKQLVGVGKYAHAGLGSGQLKLHIRFAAGDQINTLVQVSDGRVLYSTEHIGDFSQRSRIDLNRIRENLDPITTGSLEDPVIALYLAVGGQAELLRKLCQQYRWTSVQSGQLDEVEVWWLTGELATEPPVVRAFAEVDQLLFLPNNSTLLPTKVRLALGKSDPLPLWLYQVQQVRDDAMSSIKSKTPLLVVTEFIEPVVMKLLPEELFQSESSNDTIIEETRLYLPPRAGTANLPGAIQR